MTSVKQMEQQGWFNDCCFSDECLSKAADALAPRLMLHLGGSRWKASYRCAVCGAVWSTWYDAALVEWAHQAL